ncbi:MAG: YadA C-terminal domain-containing protein [Endozoicomonas sp. (ex Botrylloides leachii)]|nr:YadA C-terminal domain-containing protein [Endozoicomonas sp. (ex Botrylloides leachii)]
MKVFSKSLLYIAISSSLISAPYADAGSLSPISKPNKPTAGRGDGSSVAHDWVHMTTEERVDLNKDNLLIHATAIAKYKKNIKNNNKSISTNSSTLKTHATNILANSTGISENTSNINKNTKGIAGNVKKIDNNGMLITIVGNTMKTNARKVKRNYEILLANKESLKTSKESIDTNKESIKKNEKGIEDNKRLITANANNMATYGADFLAKNDGRLTAHDTDIAANAKGLQNEMNLRAKYDQQIRYDMTRNFAQVRNVIDHNNKVALGGIAQAVAQSALPQAYQGKSSVSIGTSYFEGENAMALGFSKNFGSDHEYTVKASVSMSAINTGASIGFGYDL